MQRRQVGVLAAVCCLAAAAVALLGAGRLATASTDDRLAERQQTTLAAADAFAAVLDTATDELTAVARALGPWSGSPDAEAAARTLLGGPLALGVLDGVLVAGADGIVLAADGASASQVGGRADPAVLAALVEGPLVTGPSIEGDGEGRLRVAVPLRDAAGSPTGVMVGSLPGAGALTRTTAALETDGGPAPRLVWSDGSVLGSDGRFDRDSSLRAPAQLAADGAGVRRLTAPAGTRMLTSYAPLRGGWAVVTTQPAGLFDAPARRPVVMVVGAILFLVASASVAVAWSLARVNATRAEADAARRSLLAVAGHELRTPLTVVSGGLQTLERRWDDLSEERKHEVLVFARRHARRLEHQVERLLFAAQLDREAALGATPRAVDAGDLVRNAVGEAAPLAPAHRIIADVDGPAPVTVDVRALEQVLFHLIENAVRYSPAGGTVTVRSARRGAEATIVVEDEGVGLPADTTRLFERFGQVEDVDTRVLGEGGLGLGLHIVRTLVERQGGSVAAASRPEGGAVFTVTLPATADSGRGTSATEEAPRRTATAAQPVPAGDLR
ncbi:MAG: sensor histidine kinase [Actinobacteria bacterium]|nr:sensor histidine kinase [Actinomycetota bacterium]